MAISEVQICNNALIKIGSDVISSLSENVKGAKLCNQLYPIIRDDMIRMHPWNFAVTRLRLAADAVTPAFEFAYQYTLPADFIRLLEVFNFSARYRVEGTKILSDDDSLEIIYIARITDVGKFDSNFSELLATRLAAEISYSLTGSATLTERLMAIYNNKLKQAKLADAQENHNDSIKTDTWVNRRGGGSDYLLHPTS